MTHYDPKLKEAMNRIESICKEYDCGGHVNLISKTHGEFRFVIPQWSCLYEEVDPDTGNVRIRLKVKKAEGDTHEDAELTAHFLHSLRDVFLAGFSFIDKFVQITDEKWKTEHKSFHKFRPQREEH